MTLLPGTRLGAYEVQRLLGAGGMGEVYLATDIRLHRPVALKLLPAEFTTDPDPSTSSGSPRARSRDDRRARFEREARLAAALRHPHICTIFEVGESEGRPFIAMEYVEGTTLHDRVRVDLFSVKETLDIAIQIADALDEARTQHVVHRDLKSTNILLTPRGDVKILDFGLAKRVDDGRAPDATTAGVTEAGMVIGTAAYMSPEQALGQPVDHRSDLFSFGVVLYELLTGRLPFTGRTTMELFSAILHDTPPAIPRFNEAVPDPLVRVVTKLLDKDRERRYQSAHEVVTDLRQIGGEGAAATGPRVMPLRRRRGYVWASVGAIVVIAGVAAVLWRGRGQLSDAASVVVLPAKVSGGPPEYQNLSEAIAVTLTNRLAEVPGLETKVSPSLPDFERLKGDAQQIVRAYGVARYVMPYVLAEGDGLTLTVRVVGSNGRDLVWSHEYTGTRSRYLTLMTEAADGVRQALRPTSTTVTAPNHQTTSSEAELALRQGQAVSNLYNNTRHQEDFDRARALFTQALERDPKLAEAAAELAWLYSFGFENSFSDQGLVRETQRWATQATTIDPRSGKGWAARARAEQFQTGGNWRAALDYGLKAAFFGPRVPFAHNSFNVGSVGVTLAMVAAQESASLDPLYLYAVHNVAFCLYQIGDSRAALPYAEHILQLEPDLASALEDKADVLADLGQFEDALSVVTRLKPLVGAKGDELMFLMPEYGIVSGRGESRAAEAILSRIRAILKDRPALIRLWAPMEIAPFLARAGQTDVLAGFLRASIAEDQIPPYDWLVLDPRLDSLRRNPLFPAIRDAARARFVEVLGVLNQARARGEFPKYLERPLAELLIQLKM